MPNEIPVVFHNGSNFGYHFIMKELANNFVGQFECFFRTKKHRKVPNFFPSNRKEITKIDKDDKESVVTISYKIKFIDSARFMTTTLSILLIISH